MEYPAPGYEAWSFRRSGEHAACYDYHFFVSYTRTDVAIARTAASALVGAGFTVFFAPESFKPIGTEKTSTVWSTGLQIALLSSCNFVGIASQQYLVKDWAGGLELNGFINIHEENSYRALALIPVGGINLPERRDHLAIREITNSQLPTWATSAVSAQPFTLGDRYEPATFFHPLPLRETSTFPWGDGSRHDPFPPYGAYERCVREIMVLLRCGADEDHIVSRLSDMIRWSRWDVEYALDDAKKLMEDGVSPY